MVDAIAAEARPKNLIARVIGVVMTPRSAYSDVVARPRALGALLVTLLVSGAALGTFMSTEAGRKAALDQQQQTLESFGMHLSDAQYERMREQVARPPYFAVAGQMIFLAVAAALVAGIALAVFNMMGGDGTFKQTFAVVAHSSVIVAIQTLFVLPLDYAREALSNPATLAVFFPFLEENTFASRLLGSVDLFYLWWIVSVSIGFSVLYRRRARPIAFTMLAVYVLLGAIIAGIKSALSGA